MRHDVAQEDDIAAIPAEQPKATALVSRRVRAGEQKRQRILDAALEIFSRNGLHGARLDQVAERADVSKTNLLYYYETKEILYLAVLSRMLDRWLEPLEALTPDSDPEQAISTYIVRKLALSRDEPAASRLFCMKCCRVRPCSASCCRAR